MEMLTLKECIDEIFEACAGDGYDNKCDLTDTFIEKVACKNCKMSNECYFTPKECDKLNLGKIEKSVLSEFLSDYEYELSI